MASLLSSTFYNIQNYISDLNSDPKSSLWQIFVISNFQMMALKPIIKSNFEALMQDQISKMVQLNFGSNLSQLNFLDSITLKFKPNLT